MSATSSPSPPSPSSAGSRPPRDDGNTRVRLQTWVNVVLVLILLASCAGANRDTVVTQVDNGPTGADLSVQTEVADLCRLLGAVAATQKVDLDTVFAGTDPATACQAAARAAAP